MSFSDPCSRGILQNLQTQSFGPDCIFWIIDTHAIPGITDVVSGNRAAVKDTMVTAAVAAVVPARRKSKFRPNCNRSQIRIICNCCPNICISPDFQVSCIDILQNPAVIDKRLETGAAAAAGIIVRPPAAVEGLQTVEIAKGYPEIGNICDIPLVDCKFLQPFHLIERPLQRCYSRNIQTVQIHLFNGRTSLKHICH